jgi:dihydroflavonol-4-reductase
MHHREAVMSRVLVTGASGHIGTNTVRILAGRDYEVIPFVRRTSDLRGIEKLGLNYRYGDVRDYESVVTAVEGCDAVVHHAAVYKVWAKDPQKEIIEPGLIGTQNILKACAKAGVHRLVYTSSIAAVGSSANPNDLRTEADWLGDAKNPYLVEKVEGEREAARLSEELGVPTIRILPAGVLGAYDYRMTPTTRMICDMVNGKGVTFQGGNNFVDVRDVADAHVSAIDRGEPGKRYIVGGDNIVNKDLGELIFSITGSKPMNVPGNRFVVTMAGLQGLAARLVGAEPFVTRDTASIFVGRYQYYDCAAAKSALGFNPRPAGEVIENAIRWLLYIGKIKPKLASKIRDSLPPDPDWQ